MKSVFILKLLLVICILTLIAGLVAQFCGSDMGLMLVFGSMAMGVFPAFHFASRAGSRDKKRP